MYKITTSPQVLYSLDHLSEGLFSLLKTRPLKEITVSDICRISNITRRTFYRNCESKEDLILYQAHKIIEKLIASVDYSSQDVKKLYTNFFNYFLQYKEFLSLLEKNEVFDLFIQEHIRTCNQYQHYDLQEKNIGNDSNSNILKLYSNTFVIGGLSYMLKTWTIYNFETPIDQLVHSILYLAPSSNSKLDK